MACALGNYAAFLSLAPVLHVCSEKAPFAIFPNSANTLEDNSPYNEIG